MSLSFLSTFDNTLYDVGDNSPRASHECGNKRRFCADRAGWVERPEWEASKHPMMMTTTPASADGGEVGGRRDDELRVGEVELEVATGGGDLRFVDVFSKSSAATEVARMSFSLLSGDLLTKSTECSTEDMFGGEIQATVINFNLGRVSSAKSSEVGMRDRRVVEVDRLPRGGGTMRFVVATVVCVVWNLGCFLIILYLSISRTLPSIGGGSGDASPWSAVFLAPMVMVGAVLAVSVCNEWRRVAASRRGSDLLARSTTVLVGSPNGDLDDFNVDTRSQGDSVRSFALSTGSCLGSA